MMPKMKRSIYMVVSILIAFCGLMQYASGFSFAGTRQHRVTGKQHNRLFMGPKTMFDKIWEQHLVDSSNGNSLIYIDRHLVHEVTSPQVKQEQKTPKNALP